MTNKKKLNVLFVVDEMPSISTPFILNQIVGILEKGHEISIFSRARGDLKVIHDEIERYGILNKTTYLNPIKESILSRFIYFMKYSFIVFFRNPGLFFKSINPKKEYARSLRLFHEVHGAMALPKKKYDIIHAQFGPLGKMMMRLKDLQLVEGKLITHFRGYDVSRLIRFESKNYYDELKVKGDFFLANSYFFRDRAIEIGVAEDNIDVLYSGIQSDKFYNKKSIKTFVTSDTLQIGSVGRLSGKKGYEYCIETVKILKEAGISFNYEIVGNGPFKEKLMKKVAELDLLDSVSFLGNMNHDDISTFLKNKDLFLSHNVTDENGDQDAPVNTLKEAVLAGCICFSTYHGGIPELIEHGVNGFMCEEKDSSGMAKNILDNIYNNSNLGKLVEAGQEKVMNTFDNEIISNRLENFYYNLLKD
jgi:colanic acid/amylovoran biosynthesis glycosyltransferase